MKELLKKLGFEHLPMLSDYVYNFQPSSVPNISCFDFTEYFKKKVREYNYFIRKPLTKGMFVPCDLDGNVLEEPIGFDKDVDYKNLEHFEINWVDGFECEQHQQAKERVLFEGWRHRNDNGVNPYVEDLEQDYKIDLFSGGRDYAKTIEQAINAGVKLILKP